MAVVGFNILKINVDKKGIVKNKVNIKNNINITNVEEAKLPGLKDKQKALKFGYEYSADYGNKVGLIKIEGNVVSVYDTKTADTILEIWKKDKKINAQVKVPIFNTALTRCYVVALILSREVNLPSPVALPKVRAVEKKK